MKDSELIQKVHSGNKEAVGIIIERYYADIYRFCLYMVQTEDDAYDIAQETFLKFMKYGTSYKHHNLKGYLLTIARNICFNYFRDKKEKVTAIEWEEIDKIPNNKDMLTEAEDAVYLRNLLKELSQDTREVIILRIYEEMKTSVYKGYKQDKIEMRGDRAEMSDFPLYLNTVAGGLDRRDQTIGGFSFVVKIYAVPVVEIIGQLLYLLGRYGFNAQFGDCL